MPVAVAAVSRQKTTSWSPGFAGSKLGIVIVSVSSLPKHCDAVVGPAATALNPYIGYDKAAEIVKEAAASGRSLREVARDAGVEESVLDEALDYRKMAKPHP